jgi:hypothetical protein
VSPGRRPSGRRACVCPRACATGRTSSPRGWSASAPKALPEPVRPPRPGTGPESERRSRPGCVAGAHLRRPSRALSHVPLLTRTARSRMPRRVEARRDHVARLRPSGVSGDRPAHQQDRRRRGARSPALARGCWRARRASSGDMPRTSAAVLVARIWASPSRRRTTPSSARSSPRTVSDGAAPGRGRCSATSVRDEIARPGLASPAEISAARARERQPSNREQRGRRQ